MLYVLECFSVLLINMASIVLRLSLLLNTVVKQFINFIEIIHICHVYRFHKFEFKELAS